MQSTEKYHFTFGSNHAFPNCFITIEGDVSTSRQRISDLFGDKWAFQYSETEWNLPNGKTHDQQYGYHEVVLHQFIPGIHDKKLSIGDKIVWEDVNGKVRIATITDIFPLNLVYQLSEPGEPSYQIFSEKIQFVVEVK